MKEVADYYPKRVFEQANEMEAKGEAIASRLDLLMQSGGDKTTIAELTKVVNDYKKEPQATVKKTTKIAQDAGIVDKSWKLVTFTGTHGIEV